MDALTREECQSIINQDHTWDEVDIVKKSGSHIKFSGADISLWGEHYPNIFKEFVLKYEVGDFCTKHIDNKWSFVNPGYHAHLVWITPLNEGYEGGELYVNDELVEQEVGVPLKYKRTTPHEVTEVTKGTRYSLVSWLFVKDKPRSK